MQETLVGTWVEKFPWRKDRLPSPGKGRGYPLQYSWASPGGSDSKEFACNAGDLGSIPGLGRSPGEGNSYPHQYSCMENPLGQRSLAVYSICSRRVRQDWATKHSTCANWKLGIQFDPLAVLAAGFLFGQHQSSSFPSESSEPWRGRLALSLPQECWLDLSLAALYC